VSIYLRLVSPFRLPDPDSAWLQPIADYDPDLRIYPSQKDYVYRLARVAHHSGGMNRALFRRLPNMNPDTVVCLDRGLVPVTTIPAGAIYAPPEKIVEQLYWRDLWAHGGAEAVADRLEVQEVAREMKRDADHQDEGRARFRAMRRSYLYRTGGRVSLVNPRRPERPALVSPSTPGDAVAPSC
jgi:hypothetical protein